MRRASNANGANGCTNAHHMYMARQWERASHGRARPDEAGAEEEAWGLGTVDNPLHIDTRDLVKPPVGWVPAGGRAILRPGACCHPPPLTRAALIMRVPSQLGCSTLSRVRRALT